MPMGLVCIKCRYKWGIRRDKAPSLCPYCGTFGTVVKAEDLEKAIFSDLQVGQVGQ